MTDLLPTDTLSQEFAERLVLTLAHFVWQAAVLGTVVFAAISRLRTCARARYGVLLLGLIAMPSCAVSTFWLIRPAATTIVHAQDVEHSADLHPEVEPSPRTDGTRAARSNDTLVTDAATGRPGESLTETVPVQEAANSTTISPDVLERTEAHRTEAEATVAADSAVTGADRNVREPDGQTIRSEIRTWRSLAPGLALGYALGVLMMLSRFVRGFLGTVRLGRLANPVTDQHLLASLQRRAEEMKLRRAPLLAWCREIAVPTVIGVVRPVVLLPVSLAGLDSQQIEVLIAHELGHIRRWDPIVNVVQRLIEAAFFFHPVTWLLSRRIRFERELCTDELVVGLGIDAVEYAKVLVETASRALTGKPLERLAGLSLQAVDQPSELTRRVHRLLARNSDELLPLGSARTSLLLLALLCGITITGLAGRRGGEAPAGPADTASRSENEAPDTVEQQPRADQPAAEEARVVPPVVPDGGWKRDEFARQIVAWIDRRIPFQQTQLQERTRKELDEIVRKYAADRIDAATAGGLISGIEKYVDQAWPDHPGELDPYRRDEYYIKSPALLRQLEWQLFYAVRRRPHDDDERKELDRQCQWIREFIQSLAAVDDFGPEPEKLHGTRLKEFQELVDNAFFPYFHEPLSEDQFAWFVERMNVRRKSKRELLFVVSHAVSSWQQALFRGDSKIPVPELSTFPRTNGYGTSNSTPRINFVSGDRNFAGQRNHLEDYHSEIMITADEQYPSVRSLIPDEVAKQGIAAVRQWAAGEKWGCLVFNREARTLEGLRGARLLGLPTKLWMDADRISTDLLRKLIRLRGRLSWPIPKPALVRKPFNEESHDAMVGVLLPDDRVFVMRINSLSPHTGLAYRARYHETKWRPLSRLTEPEADLLLGDIGNRRVRAMLKEDLLLRRHDRGLESQVNQFVRLVQQGDGSAAAFISEDVHPAVRRLLDWWTKDRGASRIQRFQTLRQDIADGKLKVAEGGLTRVLLGPDLGMNVASNGRRAFIRLVLSQRGGQQSPTLLLMRDGAWKIVGQCDGREPANDFLRDAPSHDPSWGEMISITATKEQVVRGHYLDLDSGKAWPAPAGGASSEWRQKHGIDAKFGSDVVNPDTEGAWGAEIYDTVQSPVQSRWGHVTPNVALQLIRDSGKPGQSSVVGTQLLRTREGTIAFLQTLGTRDGQVTLRFKKLTSQATQTASANAPVPPSGTSEAPPIELEWTRHPSGIEYRIRQEKPGWNLGETPLLFVDLRNASSDPHLAVFTNPTTHTMKLNQTEFGFSSRASGRSTLLSEGVTIPIPLNAHWTRNQFSRSLALEPGRHAVRFRLRVHRSSIVKNGVSVRPASSARLEPVETNPVTLVISDREIREFDAAPHNLRRELIALGQLPDHVEMPFVLRQLVVDNKPESLQWMMRYATDNDRQLAESSKLILQRMADELTDEQLRTLLSSLFVTSIHNRAKYPRGVPARIELLSHVATDDSMLFRRSDQDERAVVITGMQVQLDGRDHGEPVTSDSRVRPSTSSWSDYVVPRSGRTRAWLSTENLTSGAHAVKLIKTFSYRKGQRTIEGRVVSDVKTFRIVDSAKNELIAQAGDELQNQVRKALEFSETTLNWQPREQITESDRQEAWGPQNWVFHDGNGTGVHAPVWRITEALPVDLCFDVELTIRSTGERLRAEPMVVLQGESRQGWIDLDPTDERLSAAADSDGFLEVELKLTPSREAALSNPGVRRYYPGSITTKPMRLKIWKAQDGP